MEKNEKPKRKKVNRTALAVFGVCVMFINLLIFKSMEGEPFIRFAGMSFLVCGILGLGFGNIYRTITRRDDK